MDTAQAVFNLCADYPALVFVGDCNNDGEKHSTSQRAGRQQDHPQMHASGVQIHCASAMSNSAYGADTGTSFCERTLFLMQLVSLVEIRFPASSQREH